MQSKAKRWLIALFTALLLISFTNVADAKGKKGAKAGVKAIKGKLVTVGNDSITVKEHHKKKGAAKPAGKKAGKAAKKAGKAKKAAKGNKKKGKGGITLKTTRKTKVTLNGAKANVASLKPGMKVKVKDAGGTAKKIKAKTPQQSKKPAAKPVTPAKLKPVAPKKKGKGKKA